MSTTTVFVLSAVFMPMLSSSLPSWLRVTIAATLLTLVLFVIAVFTDDWRDQDTAQDDGP